MRCPKCDISMESCGYGDEKCPECGYMEWNDFWDDYE